MKKEQKNLRLLYEAPDAQAQCLGADCPLMQSVTIPEVVEEELTW